MHLRHKAAHCTGRWERHMNHLWRCDQCGAVAYDSADTLNKVVQDHWMAYQLRELTQEGRRLLDEGGTR